MKATQIRTEKGRSTRPGAYESRPAGGNQKTMENIDDVRRQIIREEFAVGDEEWPQ